MQRHNVSVIITTYNGAKYIQKQLDSILAQTVLPSEIIICDDRSTDDTVAIINTYHHNLINLHINGTQLGVTENFKQAAKLARPGNWLAFADQDDMWVPQKLQKLIAEMQAIDDGLKPALVYSDLTVIDKNDAVVSNSFWEKQHINPDKVKLATLVYGNVVTGCTMMINYAMATEFFEMENAGFLHDEWLALIAYTFGTAKLLTDRLVLYRQHEHNVTFAEGFEPEQTSGIIDIADHLRGKKKFLPRQFIITKAFLAKYNGRLNNEQLKIFKRFIVLENKNYLLQRLSRRIAYL